MDKMNSRDHPFGVPSHGCTEPTKSGRGVRSPRNPAGVHGAHEIRQRDTSLIKLMSIFL